MYIRYFRTMLSISKNEFNVIGFLVRNFYKRFTIRNIASILGLSAAGVHAVLKKLEEEGVVKCEKLGTGLFYEINFDSKIANHLSCVSLLSHFEIKEIDFSKIEGKSRAAIFDGKRLLVVTNEPEIVLDIGYTNFKDIKVICTGEEEFVDGLKSKNEEVLNILEKGNVLFGEENILDLIKRVSR